MRTTFALICLVSLLAYSPPVDACVAMPPRLLDRPATAAASRVLIEVDPAGTITQTMDLAYRGELRDVSWLIPVPAPGDDVEVKAGARGLLTILDSWTRLSFERTCENERRRESGSSIGCLGSADSSGGMMTEPRGVNVVDEGVAGPFQFVVLESGDGSALTAWLTDNEFAVSAKAQPIIDAITARGGGSWVAVKIHNSERIADLGGDQLNPLQLIFPGRVASLAMDLSVISMQPEMTQIVFIAAQERYEASGWANLEVEPSQLYDSNTTGHYAAWLSKVIDDAGGEAFVTEMAAEFSSLGSPQFGFFDQGPREPGEADPMETLRALQGAHPFITRMITRVSPWEITSNPIFVPSEKGAVNASRTIDLSPHRVNCGSGVIPACGDLYCGRGASCAVNSEEQVGCLCPEGQGVVLVAHPYHEGRTQPFCRPLDEASNMIPEAQWDPDRTCRCGGGECLLVSGSEVCVCPAGQVAFEGENGLVCGAFSEQFDPSVLINDHQQDGGPSFGNGNGNGGCTAGLGGVIEMAGLSLLALALRRRRLRS